MIMLEQFLLVMAVNVKLPSSTFYIKGHCSIVSSKVGFWSWSGFANWLAWLIWKSWNLRSAKMVFEEMPQLDVVASLPYFQVEFPLWCLFASTVVGLLCKGLEVGVMQRWSLIKCPTNTQVYIEQIKAWGWTVCCWRRLVLYICMQPIGYLILIKKKSTSK